MEKQLIKKLKTESEELSVFMSFFIGKDYSVKLLKVLRKFTRLV